MIGLGTIANAAAIILGSCIGALMKKGFPEKCQETIMYGIALCILIIGTKMALAANQIVLIICSLVVGALLGELMDLNGRFERFGNMVERRFIKQPKENEPKSTFGEGFISASLIFCIGAMAIIGSIEDGLSGNPQTLYAKATLDGIISMILAANLGMGVALSAISVGLYQGTLTFLASFLVSFTTPALLNEISATGGILIMAIGLNSAKITNVRIANLIPAILVIAVAGSFFVK